MAQQNSNAKELDEKGVEKLANLRIEFFWSYCFGQSDEDEKREQYFAARDTPAAHVFLTRNPTFTAQLDVAVCRVANSIKKSQKALGHVSW